MKENPFISANFSTIWTKHFSKDSLVRNFDFIPDLSFLKKGKFALYSNIGATHTKGISYSFTDSISKDYKKRVFLIYDVPQYFDLESSNKPNDLSIKKIKQYPGFLIDLKSYDNLDAYLKKNFSKSGRYKLKKYRRRLNEAFSISHKMFYGAISPQEHEELFEKFRSLLIKRFTKKRIINNNLNWEEWDFYKEVSLQMILEKKASLFVIYDDQTPIAITLNFLGSKSIFDAITVFDIDYSKFNLGYTNVMYLIEWCFENDYTILDLSKGYFDYKKRWANQIYNFEHHILYDRTYLPSLLLANCLSVVLKMKQKLREWNINDMFHKMRYFFIHSKNKNPQEIEVPEFEITDNITIPHTESLEVITKQSPCFDVIKPQLYSFLYLNSEGIDNVIVYSKKNSSHFFIQGKTKTQQLTLNSKAISLLNQQCSSSITI